MEGVLEALGHDHPLHDLEAWVLEGPEYHLPQRQGHAQVELVEAPLRQHERLGVAHVRPVRVDEQPRHQGPVLRPLPREQEQGVREAPAGPPLPLVAEGPGDVLRDGVVRRHRPVQRLRRPEYEARGHVQPTQIHPPLDQLDEGAHVPQVLVASVRRRRVSRPRVLLVRRPGRGPGPQ